MLENKSSLALVPKAKAMAARRLTKDDYAELERKRSVLEVTAALQSHPYFADSLKGLSPMNLHRAQIEDCLLYTSDGSVQRQKSAQNANAHIAQVSGKVHQRHHHAGQKLTFPCRAVQPFVQFVKGSQAVFFAVEGRDNHVAAVHLFHMAVHMSQVCLLYTS